MEDDYEYLCEFPIAEALRICKELDKAGIGYEYETDDSAVKNLTPARIVFNGGTCGLGCVMRIYVKGSSFGKAESSIARIYERNNPEKPKK